MSEVGTGSSGQSLRQVYLKVSVDKHADVMSHSAHPGRKASANQESSDTHLQAHVRTLRHTPANTHSHTHTFYIS